MFNISIIEVKLSDWLFNAGVVGFANILKHCEQTYKLDGNTLIFDSSILDNFEDMYFEYLIDKYECFTSWYNIVESKSKILEFKNMSEYTGEEVDRLNKHIENLKKKLSSNSYVKAYPHIQDKSLDLKEEGNKLAKIKFSKKSSSSDIKDSIDEQISNILQIIDYMKKDEVKKQLAGKDIAYTVVSKFWNGISFLHKTKSEQNMYKEYKYYFVDSTTDYIKQDKEGAKYWCLNCSSPIVKTKEAFNLSWLQGIGVDGNKKASHFWNLDRVDYICPICNLIYSCIPAGFLFVKERGLFINNNINIQMLIDSNNQIIKSTDGIMELEYKSYLQIGESFTRYGLNNIDKEYKNIQVIKMDASKFIGPYSFNLLPRSAIEFFIDNNNYLKFLLNKKIFWYADASNVNHYKYLYEEVVSRVSSGENLFDLINFAISKVLKQETHLFDEVEMLLFINLNLITRGDKKMKILSKEDVKKFREFGDNLKRVYYATGSEKKIDSIYYRFLSAIRVKDTAKFVDTLINAYAFVGLNTPCEFEDCFVDEDYMQSIGYAFLLGLKGYINNKDVKEGEVE